MNIQDLMNTPFKLKKGIKIVPFNKDSRIYIRCIDSNGDISLSNMSLNERQIAENLDNEKCSAWHSFNDIK